MTETIFQVQHKDAVPLESLDSTQISKLFVETLERLSTTVQYLQSSEFQTNFDNMQSRRNFADGLSSDTALLKRIVDGDTTLLTPQIQPLSRQVLEPLGVLHPAMSKELLIGLGKLHNASLGLKCGLGNDQCEEVDQILKLSKTLCTQRAQALEPLLNKLYMPGTVPDKLDSRVGVINLDRVTFNS